MKGGGHWGLLETAKPWKKSFNTAKPQKKFDQNRKPHTKQGVKTNEFSHPNYENPYDLIQW